MHDIVPETSKTSATVNFGVGVLDISTQTLSMMIFGVKQNPLFKRRLSLGLAESEAGGGY